MNAIGREKNYTRNWRWESSPFFHKTSKPPFCGGSLGGFVMCILADFGGEVTRGASA